MPQTTTRRRKTTTNGKGRTERIVGVSNDGALAISFEEPYNVGVTLKGVCPLLFHRYSSESVEEKAKAKKGSEAKRTDDIESYVYRTPNGELGMPGTWLYGAVTNKKTGAAKFRQDPRSPRKSALDLYRAGFIVETIVAPLGQKTWDYLDKQPVVVNQSRVTRVRPALLEGWETTFQLLILLPEYIGPADVHDVISQAGKLCGFGDFRPTYGRFQIVNFEARKA